MTTVSCKNSAEGAATLNRECLCVTLDEDALCGALAAEAGEEFCAKLLGTRPNLFSRVASFLPADALEQMRAMIDAVERVAEHPAYVEAALAVAPEIARTDHGPRGVFMGYDFHLSPQGPRLIEVNTNAGGAFLNAVLARAQRNCCGAIGASAAGVSPPEGFEAAVVAMFQAEWRRQRGDRSLHRIAIADDAPREQYLYPEFELAQAMLSRAGWEAEIIDARAFVYEGGRLLAQGRPVDLVYNRVTDFALARPEHRALRDAYAVGDVAVTPNPHNHALFADKRNLILLSDQNRLKHWGIGADVIASLAAGVPTTIAVTPERADELWARRRELFFKPAAGFGSRAAYRGDKLTRAVWAEILAGGFVAQAYAAPGERMVRVDGEPVTRKMDVRLYTYAGEILLAAARIYQGQTTNFRTPGGGFAPVLLTDFKRHLIPGADAGPGA